MKTQRGLFIIVFVLLPLLFIQISDAHDWGDDFAAFIAQAQAIADGKDYFQTGFVPNLEKPDLVASPIGWSLLLLPVIHFCGVDMVAFKVYVSVFFILWGIILFFVFRKKKETLFAALVVVFIFYHPQFICFKAEVLSDAAFAVLFTLSLYLVARLNRLAKMHLLILGLMIGFSCLIRPLGFVLIGSVIFEYIRMKDWMKRRLQVLIPMLSAFFLYFLIGKVIFPCENSYSHYTHFLGKEVVVNIVENAQFYFSQWQEYWAMLIPYSTGKILLAYLFFFLLIVGALRYLFLWNVYTVTVLAYLAVVFIWPFRSQGFRYIYPVLPFLVYISFESLNRIIQLNRKAATWVSNVFLIYLLVLCFTFNYKPFQQTLAQQGSQTSSARALYSFLAREVAKPSRIVFTKPRVLCLYSGVNALYPIANMDYEKTKGEYARYEVQYFARCKNVSLECYNAVYSSYLDSMEKQKVLLWSNNDFDVYKRNP